MKHFFWNFICTVFWFQLLFPLLAAAAVWSDQGQQLSSLTGCVKKITIINDIVSVAVILSQQMIMLWVWEHSKCKSVCWSTMFCKQNFCNPLTVKMSVVCFLTFFGLLWFMSCYKSHTLLCTNSQRKKKPFRSSSCSVHIPWFQRKVNSILLYSAPPRSGICILR